MFRWSSAKTLVFLVAIGVIACVVVAFSLYPFALKADGGSADMEKSPNGEVWVKTLDSGWMVHKSTYEGFSSSEDALNAHSDESVRPASYSTWQFDGDNRHVSTESNDPRGAGYVLKDYLFDDAGMPLSINMKMLGEGDSTTGWREEIVEYQPSFGTGWYDTWSTYSQPNHTLMARQTVRYCDNRTESFAVYLNDRVIKQVDMEYEDLQVDSPLLSITVFDGDGVIDRSASSYFEYGTDDKGRWTKEYVGSSSPDASSGDTEPRVRKLTRFNDEGAPVSQQDYENDGSLFSETVYSYDDAGRQVKETTEYAYGAQSSTDYYYDGPNGLLSCALMRSGEDVFSVTNYDYKGTPPAQAIDMCEPEDPYSMYL